MRLVQDKSKWQVVGDSGRIYSVHKNRRAAQECLDIKLAILAWMNDRCTEEQKRLLIKAGVMKEGDD